MAEVPSVSSRARKKKRTYTHQQKELNAKYQHVYYEKRKGDKELVLFLIQLLVYKVIYANAKFASVTLHLLILGLWKRIGKRPGGQEKRSNLSVAVQPLIPMKLHQQWCHIMILTSKLNKLNVICN